MKCAIRRLERYKCNEYVAAPKAIPYIDVLPYRLNVVH